MNVSELISIEEVQSWTSGNIITIAAPTGKGKSHFIKNTVYDYAKKNGKRILFLVHRKNCYNQFKSEIEANGKTDVIDLKTYQKIDRQNSQNDLLNFDFSQYDFIVCDEFHYWMSDSSFNGITDISLEAILNESNAIRIFVSATSTYMRHYLNEFRKLETKDYELKDKINFIQHLEFFYNDDVLEKYLDDAVREGIKAIFFIDDTKKAYELHKKYKDKTIFNCAKSNNYYKHVDEKQIEDLLQNQGFGKVDKNGNYDSTEGKLVLITTSVFDSGVNVHMDDLKHIVCDIKDTEKLIQCIGRKRRKEGEKITLCIKEIGNQQLGGIESTARNNNAKADYLKEHGQVKYINKHGRTVDNTNTIYIKNGQDGHAELKVNDMRYTHNLIKYHEMQFIKGFKSKHNYCEYIKYKLNADYYYNYDVEKKLDDLKSYLDGIIGKRLMKADQNDLIEKIDLKVNGRQQKSCSKLNEGLQMIDMPYVILPKRTMNERYWELHKINK